MELTMALNLVWLGLFAIGLLTALARLAAGDLGVFPALVEALFASVRSGFELAFGLVGVMAFWLGMLRVGERAGAITALARAVYPFTRHLFPDVPATHPAHGKITMNLSANLLGLDNAATPLGLAAMRELQTLNDDPDTASNAQLMFMILNTAGITLLPASVIAIRQTLALQQGVTGFVAADIVLPTLLCTATACLAGLITVALLQRISLWRAGLLGGFAVLGGIVGALLWALHSVPAAQLASWAALAGSLCLFALIAAFLSAAAWQRLPVFEIFVDGAKEGFDVAVKIVPYLVAMLAAIAVFRAAGCMDVMIGGLQRVFAALGVDTRFVPALPIGLMKAFSGSGARGLMIDVINHYGVASFEGKLAAIIQGSTETTFYVLAVYFGSVGVRHTRYAAVCGLFAESVGVVASILAGYWFFG